jgi:hypothetical protein
MVYALEAGGGAWCLLGALTKGKLGLLRLLGRRAHALGDVLVAVGLGISPILVHHGLDWIAVGFAEAVVLVQLRLAAWTDYDGSQTGPAARRAAATAIPATTTPRPDPAPSGAGDERILKLARVAGRASGKARRASAATGARVSPTVDGVANRLGRAAGAARRVGGKVRSRTDEG